MNQKTNRSMEHIPTAEEIKKMYNLDDKGFKKAVMNAVSFEVLKKYNVFPCGSKKITKEITKKIVEDFKKEWQVTMEAFGWE